MKTTRYTVDLDENFNERLTDLAKEKGVAKSEIIRRALVSYGYLESENQPNSGRKISITDENDRVIKDVVLP